MLILVTNLYKNAEKFQASNCNVLPWYKLRTLQEELTPDLFPLSQPHLGVYFPLYSAIKMIREQIFKSLTHAPSTEYLLTIKFGFDGSCGHSIFHQAGNLNKNNKIFAMFCPSDGDGEVLRKRNDCKETMELFNTYQYIFTH